MTQPSQIADTARSAENAALRPLRVLVAAALAVLLVLAGVDPWWMIPLAAVAAPLGLSDGGARLGIVAMGIAAGAGAVAVLAGWADLRDALVTAARDVVTGVLPWSVAIAWRARRSAEADAATALLREQDAERLRAETDLARQRLHLAEGPARRPGARPHPGRRLPRSAGARAGTGPEDPARAGRGGLRAGVRRVGTAPGLRRRRPPGHLRPDPSHRPGRGRSTGDGPDGPRRARAGRAPCGCGQCWP